MTPSPGIPRRPNDRPLESWLTVQEAATALRVSKMTVYRLAQSGELRSVRVGRSIRIAERDFDAYVRAAEQGPWEAEE